MLVSWSPVGSDGMCGPVTNKITVMPSHGMMMMMINDTVYNITGLHYNTNYIITVYATNSYGGHGETAIVSVKTPPGTYIYKCLETFNYTYVTYSYIIMLFSLALVITNGPMNVTVCSGTKANTSCGVDDFVSARPDWRIIRRNNNGSVISNETVSGMDMHNNITDGLEFVIALSNDNNANGSYLSVGPMDDTYNNTSYQCIFTINDNLIQNTYGVKKARPSKVESYLEVNT